MIALQQATMIRERDDILKELREVNILLKDLEYQETPKEREEILVIVLGKIELIKDDILNLRELIV